MQEMIKPDNVKLEENSQKQRKSKLNSIFQAHRCFPDMKFKPMSLLLFIHLKGVLGQQPENTLGQINVMGVIHQIVRS
jgi:hypothetical protein